MNVVMRVIFRTIGGIYQPLKWCTDSGGQYAEADFVHMERLMTGVTGCCGGQKAASYMERA